jgi:hypothetical protein
MATRPTMARSLVLLSESSRPKEPTTKALPKKQQREKSISFTAQSEVGTESELPFTLKHFQCDLLQKGNM